MLIVPTARIARRARRAMLTTLAAGAATLALAAAPAGATTYPAGGGSTALRLDAKTGAALTSLGVKVGIAGPATTAKGAISFPVSGGSIDGDTAAGFINHRGGLVLSAGKTRVVLSNFRIVTDKGTPRIVGRVNGSESFAPLFTLDLTKAKITRTGLGTTVSGVGVSLHPVGAKALRGAFATDAFTAGLTMGRATVAVTPRDAVFTGGATQLAVSDAALGALTTLGITPGAAPTSTLTGATYSFPITGGAARLSNLAGSITHSGGITFTKAATTVSLTDFTIDTKRSELWGKVNGSDPVAILKLDLTKAKVTTGKQRVGIDGVPGTLTAGAAAALNGAFATTGFTEGLLLGTAAVHGRTA